VDLDSIADELYGLALEEFTATRNERAKQARAGGDRQLAAQIQSIRKPTHAAWLLNQLVRSHAEETQLLLDLGRELRDVLADVEGEELRELTRQRYQLVSALVEQARALGQGRGARVTDDVAQAVRRTLEATLADEWSAEALAAGRLNEPLEIPSGFSVDSASAGRPRPASPSQGPQGTVTDLDAERKRRALQSAEKQVATAAAREKAARLSADRARAGFESLQQRSKEAGHTVDRLREALDTAVAALADIEQQIEAAQRAVDSADSAAREAAEELSEAQRRRAELPE
jgi:hypothetical protein